MRATRMGCLWIKHCEGSEGRNFSVSMDPEEDTGKSAEKRKRKPNFTTRELTIITENVEANKGILQSKLTDNVTNKFFVCQDRVK